MNTHASMHPSGLLPLGCSKWNILTWPYHHYLKYCLTILDQQLRNWATDISTTKRSLVVSWARPPNAQMYPVPVGNLYSGNSPMSKCKNNHFFKSSKYHKVVL